MASGTSTPADRARVRSVANVLLTAPGRELRNGEACYQAAMNGRELWRMIGLQRRLRRRGNAREGQP
jgi:hypothetical protein